MSARASTGAAQTEINQRSYFVIASAARQSRAVMRNDPGKTPWIAMSPADPRKDTPFPLSYTPPHRIFCEPVLHPTQDRLFDILDIMQMDRKPS
ncbi:hypothetical protein [Parasphingorhabdus sp.]|uniref:hypothetical protein n=1 Tax=Parasphingorhabdus sp. TaxID=2709688 RepID=UPI003001BF07